MLARIKYTVPVIPFTEIRKEYFPDGFAASAMITCAGFAQPEMMVEIQGIAVIDA